MIIIKEGISASSTVVVSFPHFKPKIPQSPAYGIFIG